MKFVDLLRQPITMITENDILKDIVFPDETAQSVIEKIRNKPPEDILVVYVNLEKEVQGVITSFNVGAFLDNLGSQNTEPDSIKVSSLKWDKYESTWLKKNDTIESALIKFTAISENIFIVVDDNNIYAGKVKRKNAIARIRDLSD